MSTKRKRRIFTNELSALKIKKSKVSTLLPTHVWEKIGSYLRTKDLYSLRKSCCQLTKLREQYLLVAKIEHCFYSDNCLDQCLAHGFIQTDNLEMYKMIRPIDVTDHATLISNAIFHQAVRCLEYFWNTLKIDNLQYFVGGIFREWISEKKLIWAKEKKKRDSIFDQFVLKLFLDHKIPFFPHFLYYLNCSLPVKKAIIQRYKDYQKEEYVSLCIAHADEEELIEILLQENVELTRKTYYQISEAIESPHYSECQILIAKYQLKLESYVLEKPTETSHEINFWNFVHTFMRDPLYQKSSKLKMPVWETLQFIYSLFPESQTILIEKFTNFYLHRGGIEDVKILFSGEKIEKSHLNDIFRDFRYIEDWDSSIFYAIWKAGGKEPINLDLFVDCEQPFFGIIGHLSRISMKYHLDSVSFSIEKLDEYCKKIDKNHIMFNLIHYLAMCKMPLLLEKMMVLKIEYFWIYLAFLLEAEPSKELKEEAFRIKEEESWALFRLKIFDYDGSVLSYLKHRSKSKSKNIFTRWIPVFD